MSYPVKFFTSSMRGAPVLNSAANGSLLSVLRACLVTGFGVVTAHGVSVENGIATAELNAGDVFEPYSVIQIEGATDPQLNGLARVLSASTTTITWATDASPGPATGVINIRYASAGWAMPYDAGDVGVFHSINPVSPQHLLRVDDTNNVVRVRGYESMSSIDEGVNPFPSTAQRPSGGAWLRGYHWVPRDLFWNVVADDRFFLISWTPYRTLNLNNIGHIVFGFGDLRTYTDDVWSTCLSCLKEDSLNNHDSGSLFSYGSNPTVYCARDRGGNVFSPMGLLYTAAWSQGFSGNDGAMGPFAGAECIFLAPRMVSVTANSGGGIRGEVPGAMHLLHRGALSALGAQQVLLGEGDLLGRRLMAVHAGRSGGADSVALIDITGPWR